MQRSTFNKYIKSLKTGLRVVRHSNRGEHIYHGGSDALYYYSKFIGAVPPGNIYLHENKLYRGDKYSNRSLRGVLKKLRQEGALEPHKILKAQYDATAFSVRSRRTNHPDS